MDDLKKIVMNYGKSEGQYVHLILNIDILATSIQELQKRTQQYYLDHNELYPNLNININVQDELTALDTKTISIRHRTNKIFNHYDSEQSKSKSLLLLDDDHKDKHIPGVGEDDHQM